MGPILSLKHRTVKSYIGDYRSAYKMRDSCKQPFATMTIKIWLTPTQSLTLYVMRKIREMFSSTGKAKELLASYYPIDRKGQFC
jgi:hypothetical protein